MTPSLQEIFDANEQEIHEYLASISKDDLERQLCGFGVDKIDNPAITDLGSFKKAELSEQILAKDYVSGAIAVAPNNVLDALSKDTIEMRYRLFKYRVKMAYEVPLS